MKKMFVTICVSVLMAGFALFRGGIFGLAQGNNAGNDCTAMDEGQCKPIEPALSWNLPAEQYAPGEGDLSTALGFYTVTSETDIPAYTVKSGTVRCNPGDAVASGGYRYLVEISQGRGVIYPDNIVLALNHSIGSELGLGEGWLVGIRNRGNTMIILEVTAVCADLTPSSLKAFGNKG